ncbi:MAG: hypothetical protein ACLU8D_04825 [Enterocloster sp.]
MQRAVSEISSLAARLLISFPFFSLTSRFLTSCFLFSAFALPAVLPGLFPAPPVLWPVFPPLLFPGPSFFRLLLFSGSSFFLPADLSCFNWACFAISSALAALALLPLLLRLPVWPPPGPAVWLLLAALLPSGFVLQPPDLRFHVRLFPAHFFSSFLFGLFFLLVFPFGSK